MLFVACTEKNVQRKHTVHNGVRVVGVFRNFPLEEMRLVFNLNLQTSQLAHQLQCHKCHGRDCAQNINGIAVS